MQKDEIANEFVEKFGWKIDETVVPSIVKIDFPKDFSGLPFHHYQSASLKSGIDLTPLASKKVEMRRYTLKEKQFDHAQEFTMFVHLIIENEKVSGAWRSDSSPRAPGIYSMQKK